MRLPEGTQDRLSRLRGKSPVDPDSVLARALVIAVLTLLMHSALPATAGSAQVLVSHWPGADAAPLSVDSESPPANDDFANAAVITTFPFTDALTAKGAGPDGPLLCSGRRGTVWYRFTAPTDAKIAVDTFGSDYNTRLAVYTGESIDTLTEIACNDRAGPGPYGTEQSRWSLSVKTGSTYYFRVALLDQHERSGLLVFNAGEGASPSNDDFVDAQAVPNLPFSETTSTDFATLEPNEPQAFCLGGNAASTVWYRLTPTEDVLVVADTIGSDFTTFLSVWAERPSGLTQVNCTSRLSLPDPRLAIKALAGQTYYFQAGGFSFREQAGTLVFGLSVGTRPPNDDIGDATVVSALPFGDFVDNTTASSEPDEQVCGDTTIGASVWYRHRATEDAIIAVDLTGSEFVERAVSVYVEDELGVLLPFECSIRRRFGFVASAGTNYVFQVGSMASAFPAPRGGNLSFALESLRIPACPAPQFSVPDLVGDLDVNVRRERPDLVGVSGALGTDNFCATLEFADGSEPPGTDLEVTTFAWFVFDTDENPETGSDLGYSCAVDLGLGIDLSVGTSATAGVLVPLYQPGVPDAIVFYSERSLTISIPQSALGDGPPFNFAVMVGPRADPGGMPTMLKPSDCLPNGDFIQWPAALGNANCTGVANAIDAALLLQLHGGLINTLPCDVGDVDGDNDVDAIDAALILQFVAGLLDSLPAADD